MKRSDLIIVAAIASLLVALAIVLVWQKASAPAGPDERQIAISPGANAAEKANAVAPAKNANLVAPWDLPRVPLRPGFRTVNDAMADFFKPVAATSPASAAPALGELAGSWRATITALDLENDPSGLAVNVATAPPFSFAIRSDGGKYLMAPSGNRGSARTLSVTATGTIVASGDGAPPLEFTYKEGRLMACCRWSARFEERRNFMPYAHHRLAVLLGLLIPAISGIAPAGEPPPAEVDMAFQKNLDLLHVQMKIRVLAALAEKGFFIPKTWVKSYLDEQDGLCSELGSSSGMDINAMSDWVTEMKKVKKAEAETMEKVAEDWGRKFLQAATGGAGDKDTKEKDKSILTYAREYQLKMAEWATKDKKNAIEMARYVQGAIEMLKSRGGPADLDAHWEWRSAMDKLYRGALKDRDDLIKGLVDIEKERMYYDGCLQAMKNVQDGLKIIDMVRDDKSFWEGMAEKGRDKLVEYLQQEYAGGDKTAEDNIKWGVGKVYGILKKSYDAWDKCGDLDKDAILAENPTALATCKRMAAFTALYDSVIDVAKDLTILAPIKPLFAVLEYYSKGMGLVAPFARDAEFHQSGGPGIQGIRQARHLGRTDGQEPRPVLGELAGQAVWHADRQRARSLGRQ